MSQDLGPNHPDVKALWNKIETTQRYLAGYQQRVNQRLGELQNNELGPLLVNMVQAKLNEALQLERARQREFEMAEAQAVRPRRSAKGPQRTPKRNWTGSRTSRANWSNASPRST